MYLLKATIFFAIIPFTLATDCTVSDSSPWTFGDSSGGSSSGGGSVTDECAKFDKDSAQYQACQESALQGQCNSVGGSACSDLSDSSGGGGDLIANPGDDLISSGNSGDGGLIRRLETRATLTCTSSETCYQYTNGSLVCYDLATSNYHDDAGGKGNYLEGTYTAPDEDVKGGTTSTASGSGPSPATDSNDSTPTRTGASGGSSTSSTAGAFSDAAATTRTATSASATTRTATSASATPTSGGGVLRAHAVVGALGLGAALVL